MNRLYRPIIVLTTVIFSLVLIPGPASTYSTHSKPSLESSLNLQEKARLITVRIFSESSWGSGILLKRMENQYLVVTNHHVLKTEEETYKIETADGVIHQGQILFYPQLANYDLAILSFTAPHGNYQVALLGDSSTLKEGETVIAVGFPFVVEEAEFNYTEGRISLILKKSLVDGYQIGYTNAIQKGMSGGPVLNSQGQVIAINGIHANPLWEQTYTYEDGETPDPSVQAMIKNYSWAIPINTLRQLVPELFP